ncbi:CAMK/CAMK1 protein kinase [Schizosaccharomyces japonicus yFS275]|uniref:CAMK/CAMK1 protein kinase n=1 Tax=Schizosaccharomyces japonicus (strain yFS275 / FY16936) TaxID=402676 RepID=B6K1Y7_SCHJY|nr:CAMK/CAMK1 protein kinase [Schizosaccharomyces japonicus yFS275]EEB07168.1 CAMK/CAMK1 protein kinase [Schizosaccharomyces japonicus yFS275]
MSSSQNLMDLEVNQSVYDVLQGYDVGDVIGKGSYSVVRKVTDKKTKKNFAVKVIRKDALQDNLKYVQQEIRIMTDVSVGHPNILTLYKAYETDEFFLLLTDLAEGGELYDCVCAKGQFNEAVVKCIIRQLVSAVAYIHKNGIVHRDLKPENVLLECRDDYTNLWIADFGLANILNEESRGVLHTMCGTPGYMAPECIRQLGHAQPVDLWSIGVITYLLIAGFAPFERQTPALEMRAVLKSDYTFPSDVFQNISDECKNFIKSCLVQNPNDRITAEDALRHPFLKE